MEIEAEARGHTSAFLDAHCGRILEGLSEILQRPGTPDLLPTHGALFDLVRTHLGKPSFQGLGRGVRRALAGFSPQDIQALVSGQIALWSLLHRMLREVDGPHRRMEVSHPALALAGDGVDGVIGALIDAGQPAGAPGALPGWRTLVELGRTHREFRAFNDLVGVLMEARDQARTFEALERGILDTFHLRSLVIASVDRREGRLEIIQAYPRGDAIGRRMDLSHPDILCDVVRTGRMEVIDGWDPRYHDWVVGPDGDTTPVQKPRDFNAGQTAFFVPILAQARVIGVVCTASSQENKGTVLREVDRMTPFLRQVGTALANASEIAERRRAEEELRLSEATNRAFLDAIPDMILRYNKDGVFLDFKAAKDFEPLIPPEAFLGKRAHDVLPEEVARKAVRHIEQALLTGDVQVFEYQLPMGGEARHFEARVVACGEGEALGIVRDITGRRRVEEALEASERRLRTIIEAEPECVKLIGLDGELLEMNRAGLAMCEAETLDQVKQKPALSFVSPEYRPAVQALIEGVLRGEERGLEFEIVGIRGTRRWMDMRAVPFRDQKGGIVGLLAITRDATERKRLEEQLRHSQKLEAVGRLAGGIAHDFNNLLQVIMGFSEFLLARLAPGDPSRREVGEIHRAGDRAASLTRQLLAFGRKQVLAPKVVDLNGVVAGMGGMLSRLITKDIDLVTVLHPGLWRVKADPGQIEQVILNLALNARDAMPEGGRLTIGTENVDLDEAHAREHPDARPGPHVSLSVSDTGCGISEAVRPYVFEPFFTTKEDGKGTGLGLATVYGIVTQSGGHVTVQSAPGKGSTFRVCLPRGEEGVATERPGDPFGGFSRGTETVLLVEDDGTVRDLIGQILRKAGYTVLKASQGEEALGVSERHGGPIHLLLTDVVMPRMNGRELAERLRPGRPEMRVLYVSGHPDGAVTDQTLFGGHGHFLPKPFAPDALVRKVREVIRG